MNAKITHESRLRYRQRIDPNVPSARAAIERQLADAEEIDTDRVRNAVAMAADDALFVLDESRSAVMTVLRRFDR